MKIQVRNELDRLKNEVTGEHAAPKLEFAVLPAFHFLSRLPFVPAGNFSNITCEERTVNFCWWCQKRWRPVRVGGLMCNAVLPNLPSPRSPSPPSCAVAYTVGLPLPLPKHLIGFPLRLDSAIGQTDVWTVPRTNHPALLIPGTGR